MTQKKRSGLAVPLLYAMILVAALLLTVFGAILYSAVTEQREENSLRRSALSYAQSKIQAADAAGHISVARGAEGDLLLLQEGDTGYETRIYLWQGAILEELSSSGSPLSPETAQTVCAADSFSVTWQTPALLTVSVDGLQALCCLRSEGGTGHD